MPAQRLESNRPISAQELFFLGSFGAATMVGVHFIQKPTEYKHPETPIKFTGILKRGVSKLVGRL